MNDELLRISGLKLAIGEATPVDDLDLSVGRNELVSLVGASGSGKTLTALAVSALLPTEVVITGGSICLEGKELLDLPEVELRKVRGAHIGMIFQEPMTSLNPVMTIGDQITEGLRLHRDLSRSDALDRAKELLQEVSVPDPGDRLRAWPHQLSGGLRQRVMIAMALACDPSLLIADEPTTALDVTVQAGVMQLLHCIRRDRDLGILLITHDIALAAEHSDRIAVIESGHIVEEGPTAQIVEHPQNAVTTSLISAAKEREEWRS